MKPVAVQTKTIGMIFVLIALLASPLFAQNPVAQLDLTDQERQWLKDHPVISLAIQFDNPPRSIVGTDGEIKGITVDYVRLFEKKLGFKVNLVASDWPTALDRALKYEVDGILHAAALENRKPYLNFTKVTATRPNRSLPMRMNPLSRDLRIYAAAK